MALYSMRPLDGDLDFGAVIYDFDPAMLDDAQTRKELHRLWIDKGVLVFRGIEGPDNQLKLSRIFGETKKHPVRTQPNVEGYPEIIDMEHKPNDSYTVEVRGKVLGHFLPWHFDHCYNDKINRGGVLRPVQMTSVDGQTGFLDRIGAYERLPASLKARIEDLSCLYTLNLDIRNQRFGVDPTLRVLKSPGRLEEAMTAAPDFPRAIHPLVYRKSDDGRKVLNFSPWMAEGILGMENAEGDALLHELAHHLINDNRPYFHHWQKQDMIAWDNWRMLHCIAGGPPEEARRMQRTTIAGDYGVGRFENDAAGRRELEMTV